MKKKVALITGATGLLGTQLLLRKPADWEVVGTIHDYRETLPLDGVRYHRVDIRKRDEVEKLIAELKPTIVFHTAAHGRLDYCENNRDDAVETNYKGTTYVVDALKQYGGKMVFCSTNATFDGLRPPYAERSRQNPLSVYAKTKVDAEKYIRSSGVNYTITRLMTMYGWNWQPERLNMVSMLIGKLRGGQELWMTNDVFNNMLYVGQAADFFWKIAQNPDLTRRQTFHVAGGEIANRYDTTLIACRVFGLDPRLVHEVDSAYFSGKEVTRAPNTSFSTHKASRLMHFLPMSLEEGFVHMKQFPLPQKRAYFSE